MQAGAVVPVPATLEERLRKIGLTVNSETGETEGSVGFDLALVEQIIVVSPIFQGLSFVVPNECPLTRDKPGHKDISDRLYVAYVYAYLRCNRAGITNNDIIQTIACAELIQYDLNISFFNNIVGATALVIGVVQNALMTNIYTRISNITSDIYTALPIEDTTDWFNRNGMPEAWPFTQPEIENLTICQAYKVIIILSRTPKGVPAKIACSLLVTSIVSLCKRGQVSPKFIDKIVTGVSTETQLDIDISSETLKIIWNTYGKSIPDDRYEKVFEGMLEFIPDTAMRVRLTIQQAAGAGLTRVTIIARAMTIYRDFPWMLIGTILHPELARYKDAVVDIEDNPYYGFKKNLDPVKSTLYKNVAYVAKELLLRINGETSLNGFRGINKTCKEQIRIDAIIENYIRVRVEAGAGVEVADDGTVADILRAVTGWTKIQLV